MDDLLYSSFELSFASNDIPIGLIESSEQKTQPNSYMDKIMRIYLRHNISLVCLEDFMKLINEKPDDFETLPTGKVQILERFREHRDLVQIFFFVKCVKCRKSTKLESENKKNSTCSHCDDILKTTETNFFVSMPIKEQLKKSIEDNWCYIKKFDTTSDQKTDFISDAHDGEVLKKILNHYSDSELNILSLCLNVDGANKFKSNKMSIWPIQLAQNFLPPEIRFLPQNILVTGLYYTTGDEADELNFHDYLLPLVLELDYLKNKNIAMTIDDDDYKFKPIITHCAVDLPAKSKIHQTKQHGGYYSCSFCEIPGELIVIETSSSKKRTKKSLKKQPKKKPEKQPENQMQEPPEKKTRKFVRYPQGSYKMRDEAETLRKMLIASKYNDDAKSIDGIKDISCLVGLEHFNIIWSMSVEYMHTVLSGVEKRLFNFFFDSTFSDKEFYVKPSRKKLLNSRILNIKTNASMARKPRSLNQRSNFKASEYRSMLLYYLPVCLPGIVPNVYVKHIRELSAAVYILLKASISYDELKQAEKLLKSFVGQHQSLFGKENMVMVVHLLEHVTECVRKLGPLWCSSAFPFERNNGCLMKLINGTSDVLHQVSSKYVLVKSLSKQYEKTDTKNDILLGTSVNITETSTHVFSFDACEILNFSNKSLCVYKRIRFGNTTYTSLLYTRPKRSIDYFIGLTNGTVGTAKYYVEKDGEIYVMVIQYEVVGNIDHILKVDKTSRVILAPIEEIERKYIFMNIGLNDFIVSPPNSFENE